MKFSKLFSATEWRTKVGFDPKTNKAPDGAKEIVRGLIFCRPCRGVLRFVVLPTVSLWATFFRASGAGATQFAVAAMILFAAFDATAQTTNDLSDAEIQGRNLAQKLLEQKPSKDFVQNGFLDFHSQSFSTNLTFICRVYVETNLWIARYGASLVGGGIQWLYVTHYDNSTNSYEIYNCFDGDWKGNCLVGVDLNTNENAPFAGSDFWLCDLGLEFFHWPDQKILKRENSRGRICKVLESTNPNPSTNGYSRVDSWIDEETLGIVEARAYDTQGKLLKKFYPKDVKKVNGQWQVEMMEMNNVQTGSRSRIEFDLKK